MSDGVQIRLDQAYQARAEGRIADARDAYAGAAALAREARLPLPRAHALRHLSDIDREAGRPDQALSHAEQAIALYRRSLGAPLDLANAVRLAGLALDDLGRQEAAAARWTEARALYRDAGVSEGVAEADRRLA